MDLRVMTLQRRRKRDGDSDSLAKPNLLWHIENLGARERHERRIERLDAELAREFEVGAGERSVVWITSCNEEITLWRECDARVVDASDVGCRQPNIAETLPQRSVRSVEGRSRHGVVGVRVSDVILYAVVPCEARARTVRNEDLTVRDMEDLVHGATLEHMFDLPALCDTFRCHLQARALRGRGNLA